jgi:NAD(P)H dehydrogenase (quinone)
MSNILVTGATGHLGKAVTESLLKKTAAANISVLVRDAGKVAAFKSEGVNVLVGDYDNYASLIAAFKGIDKLYMVSGNDIANRIKQQDNVVAAAKEAGVKHIVYTSFQRKNETASSPIAFVANGHLNTEEKLKASGLTYTILEHGIYADMIPIFAGEHLLQNKTIFLPAGEGKTAYAVRTDQAEAGANVLLDETGKYHNKSIELAGNEGISWGQVATIIAKITGEQIVFVSPSNEEFTATLTQAGVPAEIIGLMAGFSNAAQEGEFENITHNLETILGRKPITVADYLQGVYGKVTV